MRSSLSVNSCPEMRLRSPAINAGTPRSAKKNAPGSILVCVSIFVSICHFLIHQKGQVEISQPALLVYRLSGEIRVRPSLRGRPLAFPNPRIRGLRVQRRRGVLRVLRLLHRRLPAFPFAATQGVLVTAPTGRIRKAREYPSPSLSPRAPARVSNQIRRLHGVIPDLHSLHGCPIAFPSFL